MKTVTLSQRLGRTLRRVVFVSVPFLLVGFVVFWWLDNDDPLTSDDPYLGGFLFAGLAAGSATVYCVAEWIAEYVGKPEATASLYSIPLAGWCLFLLAIAVSLGKDGYAVLYYWATAVSLVIGVVTCVLCPLNPSRISLGIMTTLAVVFALAYGLVCAKMAERAGQGTSSMPTRPTRGICF